MKRLVNGMKNCAGEATAHIAELIRRGLSGKAHRAALLLFAALMAAGAAGQAEAAAPEVKSFVVPASHRTLTVPIIRLTATDDAAVTGYMITESDTAPPAGDAGWTVTPPAYYSFSTEGSKSLYAWVKDADGNVSSSLSASTSVGSGEALVITSIAAGRGYTAALMSDGTVIAWGYNPEGQTTIPAGLSGVVAIAAGSQHMVALKSDGTVVTWGFDAYGLATIPAGLSGVVAISAGGYHTVALKSDGTIVAWGDNQYGQTTIPAGLSGVVAIAAGSLHTLALKSDGTVVAWGGNGNGQSTVPEGLTNVTAVAAGDAHSVAVKSDGTVVAWGYNGYGQTTIPAGLTDVVAVSAGIWHTVALKSDGTVAAWGRNDDGQTTIPAGLSGVVAIAAGGEYTVALKSDGAAVAWGDNDFGEATILGRLTMVVAIAADSKLAVTLKSDGTIAAWGDNDYGQTTIPEGLTNVMAIAAGSQHTVALKSDGTVVAWGRNIDGQTTIPGGLSNVVAIAAGESHTVALKSDGTVAAWGRNDYGQTTIPAGLTGVVAIAAGNYHTAALKSDGTVAAWGYNAYGQTTIPGGLTNVVAIAAGWYHTVALKTDGTVVAWGFNPFGQTTIPGGLTNVAAIAAGSGHTVALKSDGMVVAWGNTNLYQTTIPAGLTNVAAIAAGGDHTVALKSDGTIAAWGDVGYGASYLPAEAGPDTTAPVIFRFSPAPISALGEVAIPAFNVSDDTGISGYLITESSSPPSAADGGWGPTPPAFYSAATNGVYTLYAWAKDAADNISSPAVATVVVGDTIPAAFSFIDQTGVPLNTMITSNVITVAGINVPAAISITGGTYSVNGGAYTGNAGSVNNGDQVTVQVASPASYSVTASATLNIGGVSDTFSVTTNVDTAPDAFTFTDQTDVALNMAITSNIITVSGINSQANISIVGGTYSKNGGAFTSTAGKVNNGDTVAVKVTSSGAYSTAKNVVLTMGGVSDTFTVTTAARDIEPDQFTFTDQTDVTLNSLVTSNSVTVTGINAAVPISITGGKYSINNGAFVSTAGTVNNNATVKVQVKASGSYGTTVSAVVTIGTVIGAFSATTKTINLSAVAEAVDNPTDTTAAPLSFLTSGAAWFGQDATAKTLGSAAQSEVIGNSQNSWLQTTVTGPCSISFFQKVSSEPTYDTLKFSIDGTVKSTISGEVNWQQKTFAVTTAGTHTLKWIYARNASIQKGQNAAWVDNIIVSPNTKVLVTSPNGGEKLASGSTQTVTWNAPAGAATYKLSYTLNSAAVPVVWTTIATGIETTSYDWNIPVLTANKTACKVKVAAYNTANVLIGSDTSNANFSILALKVNSPNGGESLTGGLQTNINYTINGVSTAGSVKFYYTVNNGTSWVLIGTGTDKTPGTYDYPWTPPAVSTAKTACKVKVELRTAANALMATDVSDKVFTISP